MVQAAILIAMLFSASLLSLAQTRAQPVIRFGAGRKVPDARKYPPAMPQELDGAFWRIDGGFQSTMRITNIVQTAAIRVRPVLVMADGTEYPLPALELQPAGVATLNINEALRNMPSDIAAHVSSFGSAALRFRWPWASAITATIRSLDVGRSLTYSNAFQFSMSTNENVRLHRSGAGNTRRVRGQQKALDTSSKTVSIEGLWWKTRPEDTGFLVLTNRSEAQIPVAVNVFAPSEHSQSNATMLLLPHQTQQFELKRAFDSLPVGAMSGGVRIQYKGVQGSILATGGLENASVGYSAKIPFGYVPADNKPISWRVASVGIMHGPPDPGMQFPADTRFTSYAVLRNISSQVLQVAPTLYATIGKKAAAPTKDQVLVLQAMVLQPGETRSLDLEGTLNNNGLKDVNASLTLSLNATGVSGGLLAAIGSVDQSGDYVFEVEPHPVSSSLSKGICIFEVGGGTDTMVSLWNHSDQDEDLVVTLFFNDGHYRMPVHLAAKQSAMFSVLEIIKAQSPDFEGNIIPTSTSRGSIVISGPEQETDLINVSLNAATFSVRGATCDPICQQCYGYYDIFMSPDSLTVPVGSSATLQAEGDYDTGWQYSVNAQWSSSDTSVATVSQGSISAVSAGSINIFADANLQTDGIACPYEYDSNGDPEYCPLMSAMEAVAPVKVQKPASLSVLSVSILPTGTTGDRGCLPNQDFGIDLDVKYQVLDQDQQPLKNATMVPHEHVVHSTGDVVDVDICPSRISTCTHTTQADGTFHDAPYGVCADIPFVHSWKQDITMILNGTSYAVRTNNVGISSSSSGHGSISNGGDIQKSR
jgi:hypothetical protein